MRSSRINVVKFPNAPMVGGAFFAFYPGIFEPQYEGTIAFVDPTTARQTPPIGFRQRSTGIDPSLLELCFFAHGDTGCQLTQQVSIENFPDHTTPWNHDSLLVDIVADVILATVQHVELNFLSELLADKIAKLPKLFSFWTAKQPTNTSGTQQIEPMTQWFPLFFYDESFNVPPIVYFLILFDVVEAESISFLQSLCTVPIDQTKNTEIVDTSFAGNLCRFALKRWGIVFSDATIPYPHQFASVLLAMKSLISLRRSYYSSYETLIDHIASEPDRIDSICNNGEIVKNIISTACAPFFRVNHSCFKGNQRGHSSDLLVSPASQYPYPGIWDDFEGKLTLIPGIKNFFKIINHQGSNDLEYVLNAFEPHLTIP